MLNMKICTTITLVAILVLDELMAKFRTSRVNKPVPRVIYGRDAVDNEYPYVVSLETEKANMFNLYRVCCGTLITAQHVLSAAHCVNSDRAQVVRYGDMTLLHNESTIFSKIKEKIIHPAYYENVMGTLDYLINDLGFVLIEDISLKVYGRLSAADAHSFIGKPVTYSGYGNAMAGHEKMKNNTSNLVKVREMEERMALQVGEGVVSDLVKTREFSPLIVVVPKCTNVAHQIRFGDGGAPLFYNDRIIGVGVLFMPYSTKDREQSMSYFTPISQYLTWIYTVVNRD